MDDVREMPVSMCSQCADPDQKLQARGLCNRCYRRAKAAGDLPPRTRWGIKRGWVSLAGYRYVHQPDHPLAQAHGYIAEHRLVMFEAGYDIEGMAVHHLNHDKLDNRLENLVVMSHSEHAAQHNKVDARPCAVDDCPSSALAHGWCSAHYQRWRRHGDVMPDIPLRSKARL